MKKEEIKLIGLGLAYSIIAIILSFSNEFFAITGYLFGLLAYFVLVFIGIKLYKMNNKSIYISLMIIVLFNVVFSFLTVWFLVDDLSVRMSSFLSLFIAPITGYVMVFVYIKIIRYFTEEIKHIHESE